MNLKVFDIVDVFPEVKDSSEFDNSQLRICKALGDSEEYIAKLRKLFYAKKFIETLSCKTL